MNKIIVAWLLSLVLCIFLLVRLGYADEKFLYLDSGLALNFTPVRAYFLVDFDDAPSEQYEAVLVPPYRNEKQSRFGSRWFAGARVVLPNSARTIRYNAVFFGAGGQVEFVPTETLPVDHSRFYGGQVDELRRFLLQRKEVAGGWRSQIKNQAESLQRLRSDAELIGDFGKILDTKEEMARAQAGLQNLEQDIANLQRFLRLAKTAPKPVNQVGREAQLVKQLAELAAISKKTEAEEIRRRGQGDAVLQQKLALIESTRREDIGALEAQLERAKVAREKLERRRR